MTTRSIRYTLRRASPASTRAEAVVVGVVQKKTAAKPGKRAGKQPATSGHTAPEVAAGGEDVQAAFGRKWRGLLATLGVTGKAGEITRIPTGGTLSTPLLVLVGLGSEVTADSVRRAAGTAARSVPNATSVALALPADTPDLVSAVAEGYRLGAYTFTRYQRSDDSDSAPSEIVLLSPIARRGEAAEALEAAQVLADAVTVTRDWVNTPPGDLTPPQFADAVEAAVGEVTTSGSIEATVHDDAALAELGCGGILAVGKGSTAPPRLVELTYTPEAEPAAHLALVGKGITFDSGGLTLKPGNSMTTMKSDMHGAATVVQATVAIARLGLPIKVSTFVPMAENMISGTALKPGDVVVHYGGLTTEAQNMDAEGRLVLADALVRATETDPDVILDVATLTGHMVQALGDKVTGVLGSDDIVRQVLDASEVAGEEMWPMPIPEAVADRVKSSKIADLMQADWIRWGGGLYAAAFLREFVGERRWAHLDIAGPSFNSGGPAGHISAGGTGVAVSTLIEYARSLC